MAYIFLTSAICQPVMSQSPDRISYQAVVRNGSGIPIVNQTIGMRITIVKGTADGSAVYTETQVRTTNANGLVHLEIGGGTVVSGSLAVIDWGMGPFFLKTETDVSGGTNYQLVASIQLLSVPYALHANDVSSNLSARGDTLTIGKRRYYIPGVRDVTATVANFSCGSPLTFVYRGVSVTYGTVERDYGGTIGKKCWLDRNLGATRVAQSSTDHLAYGDLFQWGRGADGHQVITWTAFNSGVGTPVINNVSSSDTPGHSNWIFNSSPPYDWHIPQNNNLWQGASGTNNPCPAGWRLPLEEDWIRERASWTGQNAAGAYASSLKLTLTGGRGGPGNFYPTAPPGTQGPYWTSSLPKLPDLSVDVLAKVFIIYGSSTVLQNNAQRHDGFSIRCMKD